MFACGTEIVAGRHLTAIWNKMGIFAGIAEILFFDQKLIHDPSVIFNLLRFQIKGCSLYSCKMIILQPLALYRFSSSSSHILALASLGIRRSPLGDTATEPTLGPSGRQERLNCWAKNLL